MPRLLGRVGPDPSSFSKRSPYRSLWRQHAAAGGAAISEARTARNRLRTAGTVSAIAAAIVSTGLLAWFASTRFARFEVEGVSMVPTFVPGDRVLVLKTRDVSVGDVVALEDPQATQRVLVKRVVGIDRSSVRVEGDNLGASRDSRDFGPVPRSAIVGRVVTRYHSPRRHPPTSSAGRS